MRIKPYFRFLIAILISAVFAGCFVWSSIKDGYENFSAYFNTYYIGKHAFEAALKDVKNAVKEREIAILSGQPATPFAISATTRQNFDLAIEKTSKVLQLYPTSQFTEDCLFIIGISYYYEDDNLRGGRKFVEAESKFPDSKRFAEAQMYYGSVEMRSRNYDGGYADLLKAIALAEKQKNWEIAAQAADNLSDYFLGQSDTATAAAYLDSAATISKDDDAAIYACDEGNLLEATGNYHAARRAYEKAWDQARDIRLRFYSRYYLARAQRFQGKFYLALGNLGYLRNDDKFFQFFPIVDYQKAEVLYDSGAVSSAVAEFQRIDTAYATSEAATRSSYRLANVYLYKVGDYQTALKFFQKCAAHPQAGTVNTKAQQIATTLQDYFIVEYKVLLADSSYEKAILPSLKKDSASVLPLANVDTLYEQDADAHQALAGFFMFKLQIPDSAINHYKVILRDFPKSRDYPSALYTLGEYYYSSGDTVKGRKYLDQLLKERPESSYAVSASSLLGTTLQAIVDSSQEEYSNAISFGAKNDYGSAVAALKILLKQSKSAIVPQALYSIGWIYENKMAQADSAFVYYKRLSTQYPSSNFSSNVTLALVGYQQAQVDSAVARKRIADSIASAEKSVVSDSAKRSQSAITGLPMKPQRSDSLTTARQSVLDSLVGRREQVTGEKRAASDSVNEAQSVLPLNPQKSDSLRTADSLAAGRGQLKATKKPEK